MCTVYHYSIQYAKRLGHILISDHVVTNFFMHSFPVIILLYMAALFLHQTCFGMIYITSIAVRLSITRITYVRKYQWITK